LNASLLNEKLLRSSLQKHISEFLEKATHWDLFKSSIRTFFESHHNKKRNSWSKINRINKEVLFLKALQIKLPNTEEIPAIISKLEIQRDNLAQSLSNYWRVRSRANWIEKGEKSTKFFFQKFHINTSDSFTTHVSKANNCSQPEAISIARTFYQNLYKTEDTDETATNQILNSLPQISSTNNDKLLEPISSKEISNVIKKLPNNKSPGADGLSYEFYKSFSHSLLPYLTLLFNQVLLTNTSPLSWKASNIVLIPKKSEDKSLIQNWRPIALLNSDCKIFMKIIANRLNKKILNTIIGNHQSGFCANRNILDAFLEYNMILENLNKIPTLSWLVFLNQKKTFFFCSI